ncbi:MAG: hypothetical protein HOM96_03125 [Rickettsiales bacterium]|jgi:glycerophosphoryl diester phosphodiesterase|nr:hypothetical protein [Rickettsiales bacterium]
MSIPKFITHACGEINGIYYSNSKEALEHSYYVKHSKYIEIDINLSQDGKYVLIHDWLQTFSKLFGYEINTALTSAEFTQLKIHNKLTTLSLDDFLNFMQSNQDLYMVSDVKAGGNARFYNFIISNYPNIADRVFIQCYSYEEYLLLQELGAKKLILSLYKEEGINFDNLDKFIKQNNISYVSINKPRASLDFILSLRKNNVFILTHTVNNEEELNTLIERGVNSVFTDKLYL